MDFGLKGLLGSAEVWKSVDAVKKDVVDEATAKFGPHAAPIADWVANKIESAIAAKLGVSLPQQAPAAPDSNPSQR